MWKWDQPSSVYRHKVLIQLSLAVHVHFHIWRCTLSVVNIWTIRLLLNSSSGSVGRSCGVPEIMREYQPPVPGFQTQGGAALTSSTGSTALRGQEQSDSCSVSKRKVTSCDPVCCSDSEPCRLSVLPYNSFFYYCEFKFSFLDQLNSFGFERFWICFIHKCVNHNDIYS